ncbi:MAG: hypothetical protein QOH67_4662 [Hyphomicrobiales bacterium]|jgi:hypothetical protein|nr:hypothetical protein [Hyphomicrobiales bacterium]
MSLMTAAVLAGALLVPATPVPPAERPTVLALNPQPEPPGRAKIKRIYTGGPDSRRGKIQRIYTGGPDSRRNKTIKIKPIDNAPATKY